jgi:hypothetical protein
MRTHQTGPCGPQTSLPPLRIDNLAFCGVYLPPHPTVPIRPRGAIDPAFCLWQNRWFEPPGGRGICLDFFLSFFRSLSFHKNINRLHQHFCDSDTLTYKCSKAGRINLCEALSTLPPNSDDMSRFWESRWLYPFSWCFSFLLSSRRRISCARL